MVSRHYCKQLIKQGHFVPSPYRGEVPEEWCIPWCELWINCKGGTWTLVIFIRIRTDTFVKKNTGIVPLFSFHIYPNTHKMCFSNGCVKVTLLLKISFFLVKIRPVYIFINCRECQNDEVTIKLLEILKICLDLT